MAGGLLDRGTLTLRDRELVIDRTCFRCGSEYEWGVHVAFFARAAGLAEAQLEATVHGAADDPAWTPRERLLVATCDALRQGARIADGLYAALADAFDAAQILEIVALVGQYHMIAFVTNGAGVTLEPDAPRFPPARL